jgi:hypothetical protein
MKYKSYPELLRTIDGIMVSGRRVPVVKGGTWKGVKGRGSDRLLTHLWFMGGLGVVGGVERGLGCGAGSRQDYVRLARPGHEHVISHLHKRPSQQRPDRDRSGSNPR